MTDRPPGRPPAPPLDLDAAKIAELVAQSREFAKDKGKLKAWLAPKRIFHVLFQDHLSTLPIPGGKGVALNAQSSKLFLEMSEPLAAALEGVEDDDPDRYECPECGLIWLDGRKECVHRVTVEDGGKVIRPDEEPKPEPPFVARYTFVNTKTGKETDVKPPSQRRVDVPAQRPGRVKRRKPARSHSR